MAEKEVKLPDKINSGKNTCTADKVDVLLNGFYLDLKISHVYQFELNLIGERAFQRNGCDEIKLIELAKGPKNDESKESRRRLCWQLYKQLLEQHSDFFGTDKFIFVYDCASLLYCLRDLNMQAGQKLEFIINVNNNMLDERTRSYARNLTTVKAFLFRTDVVVDLRSSSATYASGDQTAMHFLELLTSQRVFDGEKHYCFRNKIYEENSAIKLKDDPRILKSGMQKNIRMVGDNIENAKPLLQIDPKKSAFFPGCSLIDFVCDFVGVNPRDLEKTIWQREHIWNQANKQVKGLVLQTLHLKDNQVSFSNAGLTKDPADSIYFECKGKRISVTNYFAEHYQLIIRYRRLPCVIKRSPKGDSYYPLETLKIWQGQRVPIEKQTPQLTEQMIRNCQIIPSQLPKEIEEQRRGAEISSTDNYFRAHNIKFDSRMVVQQANVLFPPAIQYNKRDVVEPDQRGKLDWRMTGRGIDQRTYLRPMEWPRRAAAIIVQGSISRDVCLTFCKQLCATAESRGMAGANFGKYDEWAETNIEYVEQRFKQLRDERCQFIMFFAEGKRKAHAGDFHHVAKLMEQRYRIITQHIGPDMAKKGAGMANGGPGGAAMVRENILLKTNLKLGGINYGLITSQAFMRIARIGEDILGNEWLNSGRMFFGIDMSHAPPQNLFERQRGVAPTIPTVVGMAYTMGKYVLSMRGTYWMQPARQAQIKPENLHQFIENIKEALLLYERANGKFPKHLIVYKGGASEGEFKHVAYWEGGSFLKACNLISQERQIDYQPALTIVVCQRQSNYRVIPARVDSRARAMEQNVQPGTVVDKGVMSATLTEFLLVGHKALQGTAQPVRCTVVLEHRSSAVQSKAIPLDELENMTYALCYGHGICCMPTALPAPLYEAGELAKRGRNNWKTHTNEGDIMRNSPTSSATDYESHRATAFDRVSAELKPKFDTKFWA
ncbi:hypothetical protein ACQ4LE_004120 [Meloidogyne hapla]|uniref:Piwi domain-containing protein n=1 Tax=Meloidogyne hapla TaxID=6305 RepID=A0A1I8BWL4_MELHA